MLILEGGTDGLLYDLQEPVMGHISVVLQLVVHLSTEHLLTKDLSIVVPFISVNLC